MQKLKVAIIVSHPIQHFCPQYVSFSTHSNALIKVFFGSAMGYRPYIDDNFKEEISWGNLNLEKFDHVFLNGDHAIPVTKELDAPSLDKELETFSPHILITYGYFQKLQRRAFAWARKNRVPIAYIADSERRQQRGFLKELLKYPFLRWYFSRINYFLTVGDANETFYTYYKVPAGKLIRMHFPIDIDLYSDAYSRKVILNAVTRNKYNIGEKEIVLSVVGKLVSWKNQDHIIDAMIRLEKESVYLVLFIVGSGEKMAEWKEKTKVLSKSKVHFIGFVNTQALPAYYASTDIYIHPALAEPHSIAISEAIYMGCPVIISNTCGSYGPNDDVQEGKNGFVYEFGNIEMLSSLIRKLARGEELRKSFSEYSHQSAIAFQQRAHQTALDDIYIRMNESLLPQD